ncbi:methionyl-tRNA formyltransferase [Plebeiibacterium sediminum]|uniref:Methionyl-tRNA formyltransferase n=1 Tax=Plebeiibacterium sediminum TaxID=2992112 RepID=A0AAE3M4F6_9BACT|nr:methionyl-tRNA formyltransferase [Plebeiobacterium sediminum]MCW3786699.1 methionyl-tRNA formyltransferase [Plebeiobacterium sediminum]
MIKKEDLRIVFMGTPEFAVESLKALVENKYNVVGVVTVPDKPAGRGQKIKTSPVKDYALEAGIKVLQPEKLRNEDFLAELKDLNAHLQIIVAFRMLPEVVWNMPPMGSFNLHGSLLPQYRGAAPINWAVINGDKETGVTTFFLKHEIDTGNIIDQKKLPIEMTDNAGAVHDKMMVLGAELVLETVDNICNDKIKPVSQEDFIKEAIVLNPAPKIFKEDCKLDWSLDVEITYNKIRGLSPYPAAWTELIDANGKKTSLKIFETEIITDKNLLPGQIETNDKDLIYIGCSNGCLKINTLQLAGKKRMTTKEFLNGFKNLNDCKAE